MDKCDSAGPALIGRRVRTKTAAPGSRIGYKWLGFPWRSTMLRRFSPEQLALCDEWFGCVETVDDWEDRGPVGEGESQSIRVQSKSTGLMGVAKPGPAVARDSTCRAAHEKIAFDLAHVLGLPIPPVVLWGKDLGQPFVRGRSISAWAFRQAKKWDEAQRLGVITTPLLTSASAVVSAMRVFHTWISDTDRKSDHTQVDLESDPTALGVAFIDHAFSMSHQWKGANAPTGACPTYMPAPEHRDMMIKTADEISAFADAEIERIVNRIPTGYLPMAEQEHIRSNLKSRKRNLRALLGL
jgi:hypothetical protein